MWCISPCGWCAALGYETLPTHSFRATFDMSKVMHHILCAERDLACFEWDTLLLGRRNVCFERGMCVERDVSRLKETFTRDVYKRRVYASDVYQKKDKRIEYVKRDTHKMCFLLKRKHVYFCWYETQTQDVDLLTHRRRYETRIYTDIHRCTSCVCRRYMSYVFVCWRRDADKLVALVADIRRVFVSFDIFNALMWPKNQ